MEEREAVGTTHEGVHEVLGVGHQAEDAEVGGVDAGDGAGGAVGVGTVVAEGDEVLAFEAVDAPGPIVLVNSFASGGALFSAVLRVAA